MKGLVVQLVERRSPKPDVMGSNPIQPILHRAEGI